MREGTRRRILLEAASDDRAPVTSVHLDEYPEHGTDLLAAMLTGTVAELIHDFELELSIADLRAIIDAGLESLALRIVALAFLAAGFDAYCEETYLEAYRSIGERCWLEQ